jgi:beta-phosphoglucomutase
MECLDIILELGHITLSQAERERTAAKKNSIYLGYVGSMDASSLLDGAEAYLGLLKKSGIRTALASVSRNARKIIDAIGIRGLLDAFVDGTMVRRSKPDPEAFLLAAEKLGIEAGRCVVFEDALAGIQAAHSAGMKAVGIGCREALLGADVVIPGLRAADLALFEPSLH